MPHTPNPLPHPSPSSLPLQYTTKLAACPRAGVQAVLEDILASEGIPAASLASARVYFARDTRPHSPRLAAAVRAGAECVGASVVDCGLLTTPQLHHIVRVENSALVLPEPLRASSSCGGDYRGEGGYYRMLRDGYVGVLSGGGAGEATGPAGPRGALILDCANGVGGLKAPEVVAALTPSLFSVELRNTGATEAEAALLNEGVGAEHAQKERLPPSNFSAAKDAGRRCASLDGDADRVVYHYFKGEEEGGEGAAAAAAAAASSSSTWRLLDGDKIACLGASFVGELLAALGVTVTGTATHAAHGAADHHAHPASAAVAPASGSSLRSSPVSVGIVQTAYANGASTGYVSGTLRLPSVLAKTGVKFVHAEAAAYDVGVYFEANGHGTVLFHADFVARIVAALSAPPAEVEAAYGAAGAVALRRLFWLTLLVNQAIGDALSDVLLVEAVLALRGWGVADWDAIYADLPSRQAKLAVRDRTAVTVTADETRVVAPSPLQDAVDALVAAAPKGRAFIRPSGTEDVLRVYAEAETQDQADALCKAVVAAAHKLAGGL
jgi:phosphoacetylglucosamine mutase